MDSSSSVVCDAALLLVIGEPHSDEHKSLILAEVTKGEALVFTGFVLEEFSPFPNFSVISLK